MKELARIAIEDYLQINKYETLLTKFLLNSTYKSLLRKTHSIKGFYY